MIDVSLNKIAQILKGKIFGKDIIISNVAIDTSKVTKGCIFIALKGKRFDAHDFVLQAQELGASALLVNKKTHVSLPQIVVNDTRLALGQLAAWVRQQTDVKVAALTGSSGKTSVKEMTAKILSKCGNTLATLGNLNNYIGISKTLLSLTKEHDYAIIEIGANSPGEIAYNVNLIRPEVALINNLSESHIEGFGSLNGVAKSKGEIFTGLKDNGIAIINFDNNDWINWRSIIGSRKTWFFSTKTNNVDFYAKNIFFSVKNTEFTIFTPIGYIDIILPLIGLHNINNALAATAISMAIENVSLKDVKLGLEECNAIPGRLYPIRIGKSQLIIDDSYNANVSSMISAIRVLNLMPGYRVMVIGDMNELGNQSDVYHTKVGRKIKTYNIDLILSIGKFSNIISNLSGIGIHFNNKNLLVNKLKLLLKEHENITVLIKGSRSAAMDEVVKSLQVNSNDNLFS